MDPDRNALKSYLHVFSWLLLTTALLPIDFHGANPVWPWVALPDGQWADALTLLSPFLGFFWFQFLARSRWSKVSVAFCLLGSLAIAWLFDRWSLLGAYPLGVNANLARGLPALFSRALWVVVLGLALIAAGTRLGGRGYLHKAEGQPGSPDPKRPAAVIVAAGMLLVVLFYLLPHRGNLPLLRLVEGVILLSDHLDKKIGFVLFLNQLLALGPMLLALAAGVRLVRPAPGHGGFLVALLVVFLPILMLVVGLRNLVLFPAYAVTNLRSAILLLTLTLGIALSLSALVRWLWYRIPWGYGSLSRIDERLVHDLAAHDPEAAWLESARRLHPLLRPFVRRRLALWKAAASEAFAEEENTAPRLAAWLAERWGEEIEQVGPPGAAQASGIRRPRDRWPLWMQGHFLTALAAGVLVIAVSLTLLVAHRPSRQPAWETDRDNAVLARIFEEELPSVIVEMGRHQRSIDQLATFVTLDRSLVAAESGCVGIRDRLVDLLRLGRRGRHRLKSIHRARDRLNRLLQENHVPYFVRSRVRFRDEHDLFYLLVYRVADTRPYRLDGRTEPFLVLDLVRADNLGLVEGYMGYAEEKSDFVYVIFDRLGEFFRESLYPLLQREDDVGELARQGLEEAGIRVGDLVSLTDSHEENLYADEAGAGGELDDPGDQEAAQVEHTSSEKLSDLVLAGLTRHELHHSWIGPDPEPPAALWGWLSDYSESAVRSVAAELGAYLGECHAHPAYARLKLAVMLDSLDAPGLSRNRHALARLFLLAHLLGEDLRGPLGWLAVTVRSGAHRLRAMSSEDLDRKLEELHRRFFGSAPPAMEPVRTSS